MGAACSCLGGGQYDLSGDLEGKFRDLKGTAGTQQLTAVLMQLENDKKFRSNPVLNISSNDLAQLPIQIQFLRHTITALNVSQNMLNELPSVIGDLVHLEELDANDNKIKTLTPRIAELKKLKKLYLYKNKLSVLPDEIGELQACVEMNLFNNELIKLPPAIAKLEQLEEFNAADNKLKTTPNLDGLTSLTRLALFNNNIVIMPPLRGIAKIQKIELYRNQLDVLPTIDTFDQMDEFQVANNRLMALPDNIGQQSGRFAFTSPQPSQTLHAKHAHARVCVGLEALEASRNMLTQVPESVCKLDKLWKLMLSNNKVNISWLCVYAMEFMLPNIKHGFDLFSHRPPPPPSRKHSPLFSRARTHKLTSLPPALFKLSLRTLDISANLFEELPAGLDDCNTLVNLMVGLFACAFV